MSTPTYHKTATRDVRPFFATANLEVALDGASICLYEGQPFTDATVFTVEEQDVTRLAITVRPNLDEAALVGAPITRRQLSLAITAVNPFLKRTVVVHRVSLAKDRPTEFLIGSEVLEELGGGANLTIDLALWLESPTKREVGKPFLRGHWLSKKSFHLRPPRLSEDFEIEPMDDDGWRAMSFPSKTLFYVEYFGGFNEPSAKERPIAKVRIHADVYKKLAADNLQKTGRSLMAFLAAEISCQLVASSFSDWKDAQQAEPRSPLAAFLKRIGKVEKTTLEQLKVMTEHPGMPKLRAMLHTDQESVRRVAEA